MKFNNENWRFLKETLSFLKVYESLSIQKWFQWSVYIFENRDKFDRKSMIISTTTQYSF